MCGEISSLVQSTHSNTTYALARHGSQAYLEDIEDGPFAQHGMHQSRVRLGYEGRHVGEDLFVPGIVDNVLGHCWQVHDDPPQLVKGLF